MGKGGESGKWGDSQVSLHLSESSASGLKATQACRLSTKQVALGAKGGQKMNTPHDEQVVLSNDRCEESGREEQVV